jgi:chorismate synthase
MSLNSFGHLFRVTTWGESHGPALGATVDGCPPGVAIDAAAIQHWLDRRKPGQNKYTTQRREPDEVEILSGVFEGQSTGTPIQLMIRNTDQRSKDYGDIAEKFRPGHADITYWQKYGIRDYRGGGRSSARETAARVAAGGVARAALADLVPGLSITGYMVQMGPHGIDRTRFDAAEIERNPFWVPDATGRRRMGRIPRRLAQIGRQRRRRDRGRGARRARGPWRADLWQARHRSCRRDDVDQRGQGRGDRRWHGGRGADRQPERRRDFDGNDGWPVYSSNHAGGILGGISTGQDVVVRFAVKPTSSILKPRKTITKSAQRPRS